MEFGELSDNPFSTPKPKRRSRKPFVSAVKFLLLVAVCLGATVVIGSQSRRWLVQKLSTDFDSLTVEQKQTRLTQIADLGLPGIHPLVAAMADEDPSVARTAYELLQQIQTVWASMDQEQQNRHHHALIQSLEAVAILLPDDRTGWGTELLQPAILASVDRRDDASRGLYRRATNAIDRLALSQRSGPSVLSDERIDRSEPRRLTVRSRAVSVSQTERGTNPIKLQSAKSDLVDQARTESRIIARSSGSDSKAARGTESSIYRSGNAIKLRPTSRGENVVLQDIGRSRETSYQSRAIHSVAHVVDSPVEALDDQSVMLWLGSPHTPMREKAKTELIARGFGDTEISIATQIAAGDTPSRLVLVNAIARSDKIDPRPWLLMLLDDENRQVKLRAISILATMKDAYVDQRLRKQLVSESDAVVSDQIRRVLELR